MFVENDQLYSPFLETLIRISLYVHTTANLRSTKTALRHGRRGNRTT